MIHNLLKFHNGPYVTDFAPLHQQRERWCAMPRRPAGRRRPSMLMSELSKYTSSYA
jgi:hypothetical protein